jgi:FkbM family methyltransferase
MQKFKFVKKILFGKHRKQIIDQIIKEKSFRYIREFFYITYHPNETDLFNFPNSGKPLIIDVGAFTGVSAKRFIKNYPAAKIYLFEPVQKYYLELKNNFLPNNNVICKNLAITADGRNLEIIVNGAGSSGVISNLTNSVRETCNSISISNLINSFSEQIDLMQMNCEGGEYEILEAMAIENLFQKVNSLNIQFHYLSISNYLLRAKITRELKKTHVKKWSILFIWERWEIKDSSF